MTARRVPDQAVTGAHRAVTPTPTSSAAPGRAPGRTRGRLALGWEPPNDIDRAGWLVAGTSLAEFGRVNNWWLGDWIRYGTVRWGEKYVEAAKITGLDGKTLRNIAYVASRFDLSRRRDNLTWTHHAEVAALAPEQQEEWLDRAHSRRMSPGDLRLEVRSAARAGRSGADSPERPARPGEFSSTIACPHCGGDISLDDLRDLSTAERVTAVVRQ